MSPRDKQDEQRKASIVDKLKLLIIEDDVDQRDLIRETLEDQFGRGTVLGVATIAEALAQDLASFDMILSDYNLPDGSGIQLLEQVRRRCSTPVIMVTGENVGQIAIEAIKRGATDYIVKIGDYLFTIPLVVQKNLTVANLTRENEQLRQSLEAALADLKDKNGQLQASLQRVEELAATDPLTGLYNRRHFSRVIDQLFAEAQRYGTDLSCIMIDMDGFKQINDGHGHQVGDQLLVLAGRVISTNMRRMDVAARYGGDEFVVLLPHASEEDARAVAQRIREEFHLASAALLNRKDGVTMSVGIGSLVRDKSSHADQLVATADVALYAAKSAGRDRIMGNSQSTTFQQTVTPPPKVPAA
jgi:diguanylate cyclase (GGDEF)-like protein